MANGAVEWLSGEITEAAYREERKEEEMLTSMQPLLISFPRSVNTGNLILRAASAGKRYEGGVRYNSSLLPPSSSRK